jgi:hypothetical protein
MLHWFYIIITGILSVIVGTELFMEQRWRNQIALAMILIPLFLRILHIK